jgi:hypothetical protein
MSLGKALLFGAIGVGAGLLLAAWAETMDSGDSSDSCSDGNDDSDFFKFGSGKAEIPDLVILKKRSKRKLTRF